MHSVGTITGLVVGFVLFVERLGADDKAPAVQPSEARGVAQSQHGAVPPLNPGQEITNSIGMKLVLIRAGNFMMGSPDSDKDAQADEKPQHRVRIKNQFYLGKYEVTRGGVPEIRDGDEVQDRRGEGRTGSVWLYRQERGRVRL